MKADGEPSRRPTGATSRRAWRPRRAGASGSWSARPDWRWCIGAAGGYFGEAAASPVACGRATGPGSTPSTTAPREGAGRSPPRPRGRPCCARTARAALPTRRRAPPATNGSDDIGSATHVFIRTTTDGVTIRVYQDAPELGVLHRAPHPESARIRRRGGRPGLVGLTTRRPTPVGLDSRRAMSRDGTGRQRSSSPTATPWGKVRSRQTQCVVIAAAGSAGAGPGSRRRQRRPTGIDPGPDGTGHGRSAATTIPATAIPTTATTTTAVARRVSPRQLVTGVFGVVEGDPVWWVAVEVGTEVTSVRVTFPDGATDEMAPVGGVAVLAHQRDRARGVGRHRALWVRGTLAAPRAGGSVLDTVTLPQHVARRCRFPRPCRSPLDGGTEAVPPNVIEVCPPPTRHPRLSPRPPPRSGSRSRARCGASAGSPRRARASGAAGGRAR